MTFYNHAEFNLTHKRDEIDAEERRLIDEAVAAGKVERIPQGKSAFAEDYVWEGDPNVDYSFGKLVPVIPLTFKERKARYNPGRKMFHRDPKLEQLREEVLRLIKQGLSYTQVGEALNISKRSVGNHCKALKKAGKLEARSSNGMSVADLQARREKALELFKKGLSYRLVGEALGVTKAVAQSDKEALVREGRLEMRSYGKRGR